MSGLCVLVPGQTWYMHLPKQTKWTKILKEGTCCTGLNSLQHMHVPLVLTHTLTQFTQPQFFGHILNLHTAICYLFSPGLFYFLPTLNTWRSSLEKDANSLLSLSFFLSSFFLSFFLSISMVYYFKVYSNTILVISI